MEFWLLVVIGILLIIIFSLVIKLFFVHKTVREIEAQFTERLMTETNTLIDISHRNKIMCGFAKRLNTELRKLRKERHRFQQGDLELKNAVTIFHMICGLLLRQSAVIWICLIMRKKVKKQSVILKLSEIVPKY